jgi:hypothetical protein
MFIFAQIVGGVALLLGVLTFQARRYQTMMTIQIVAAGLMILHFVMLDALTGAALSFASLIRSICFRKFVSKKLRHRKHYIWTLVIIQAIGIGLASITWEGWLSLLPLTGWMTTTLAFWQRNEQHVRSLNLAGSPPWLVYDLINGSVAGVVNELLQSSSSIIGLWRFRKKT